MRNLLLSLFLQNFDVYKKRTSVFSVLTISIYLKNARWRKYADLLPYVARGLYQSLPSQKD